MFSGVVSEVKNLGKVRTLQLTVCSIMDFLLTYSAGKGFSFKGKSKEKSGFQQLCLYKVISHCTKKMFPRATVAEIDKSTEDWLIACTKREKRRQNYLFKTLRFASQL
ncbi:uncharacterized protein LOC122505681 [Leptopilina heterotoma]|uniref:uncharacterized protein LOC122505681 n=1 Tax=Leptopilina heterotoma TaxID=63436 RepID=UPI001CA8675D|nr:uncharacterized protein LOC122505681 [Leptopilina heterotoma]